MQVITMTVCNLDFFKELDFFEELSDEEISSFVGSGSTTRGGSAARTVSKPSLAILASTGSNGGSYKDLLNQSTAQTLAIQTSLLNHNLTIGPVMAAKSASEDAKKT
jgi:hypothetical protein